MLLEQVPLYCVLQCEVQPRHYHRKSVTHLVSSDIHLRYVTLLKCLRFHYHRGQTLFPPPKVYEKKDHHGIGLSQPTSQPTDWNVLRGSPCVRRGLRSYQKTLQVPELQKGIPNDLNIGPRALTRGKISKTTKPKNLASLRSSRASDGLSALCQLIASWSTPSLRRHSASTTLAVRSNTQSINQSTNQSRGSCSASCCCCTTTTPPPVARLLHTPPPVMCCYPNLPCVEPRRRPCSLLSPKLLLP